MLGLVELFELLAGEVAHAVKQAKNSAMIKAVGEW